MVKGQQHLMYKERTQLWLFRLRKGRLLEILSTGINI